MATQTLSKLPKKIQTVARAAMSQTLARSRARVQSEQTLGLAISGAATLGAAFVDHKFRTGDEAEARLGNGNLRPPTNAAIALVALGVGLLGPKKFAAPALATSVGFGSPALYNFARMQFAK